jgi:hypothetical protein
LVATFTIDISTVCFKEGTQILAYVTSNYETYVPIENIKDNMFIKTFKHGYKKVKYILKSRILNSSQPTINKLFRMPKSEHPYLTDDLYITGSHAILYDTLSHTQKEHMHNLADKFKHIMDYNLKLDGKHKLIAYYDEHFEECMEDAYFNIYHLVLESDTPDTNYGIYANGLLVESTDEITLSRIQNYSLINSGFQPIDTTLKKGLSLKKQGYSSVQAKTEKYMKHLAAEESVDEEEVAKKKLMIHNEKERLEQEEKERKMQKYKKSKSKSYTYKRSQKYTIHYS